MALRFPVLRHVALASVLACLGTAPALAGDGKPSSKTAAQAESAASLTIRVLAFNDFHGNLESPGTFRANAAAAAVPAGGADYLAGYIAAARAANPNTVVVSTGDLIGASPLVSALFRDEPTIEVMNRIGLDFNVVGNHEFDDGRKELMRMQRGGCHPTDANSCRGAEVGTAVPFEGAAFRFLAANVKRQDGQTLLPAYGIRSFKVGQRAVKVAFIGVVLKETPQIVSPSGVRGLSFEDEADTVNALVPQLRARGVESIVLLVHQGGGQSGVSPFDINACEGNLAGSPMPEMIGRLVDGVDVVLTAHTHNAYVCQLPLASGRKVPVTSASAQGRVLTQLDLTLSARSRDVVAVSARNVVVDRTNTEITPDAGVASLVSSYKTLMAPIANRVIGSITSDVPNTKDAACNMPAGDLVADAQLEATRAAAKGGAHLALMNPGGVRSPGFLYASGVAGEGDGKVTYGESFTVQPFGNSLVTMTLNNEQIKRVLEQQFPNCLGQTTFSRVLLPSSGLRYEWDHTQACGAKVRNVTLTTGGVTHRLVDAAGVVQEPGRTWRVTVNSFLADGGDAFTTLKEGTQRLGGSQDLDALEAYLSGLGTAYDPQAASLGKPRIVRVDGGTVCP